jgi:hypothetical protein
LSSSMLQIVVPSYTLCHSMCLLLCTWYMHRPLHRLANMEASGTVFAPSLLCRPCSMHALYLVNIAGAW